MCFAVEFSFCILWDMLTVVVRHNDSWKSGLRPPPKDYRPQTEDVTATKGVEFEDLHLRRELLMGIFEAGFERPSPIQEEAIPIALTKRDVLARAKNGTGKTAAFVIPSLQQIDINKPKIQALLLVPTRELALQSHDVLAPISSPLNLPCIALFGGAPKQPQVEALREGASIVVGTPGRIKDLVNDGELVLGDVDYLVLDEADRMLDKGFENDIRAIIGYTRAEGRQTVMFR